MYAKHVKANYAYVVDGNDANVTLFATYGH
jgi:hypothetical protein